MDISHDAAAASANTDVCHQGGPSAVCSSLGGWATTSTPGCLA